MKKVLVILSILFIGCNQQLKKGAYTINVEITGLKDSLKVLLVNTETHALFDSTYVKNNKFSFNHTSKTPFPGMFFFDDKKTDYPNINFWIEDHNINIKSDLKKLENGFISFNKGDIKGSLNNSLSIKYHSLIDSIYKKRSEYLKNTKNKKEIDSIKTYYKNLRRNFITGLLFKKPCSFSLNEIEIYRTVIPKDSLSLFYNSLPKGLKNTKAGKYLYSYIHLKPLKEGELYRDIIAKDLQGNIVKLSGFKGKTILLDFWDRYCPPCRIQNKDKLPLILKKYKKENFVLISYSLDKDYNNWKIASKEDTINWINISDLGGFNGETAFNYGIVARPTFVLIDKNGIVVKNSISPSLEEITLEIDKLLKEN